MAVLVTGGAGYIGSHMVLALLDAGEDVVVLDNLSTGFAWALPPEAELVVGDMGDQDLVARLIREHRIAAIAHFAAKIVVPESVADPLGYYLNNTVKSRALIEAAIRGGVEHFIFSSTAAVYGDVDVKPVAEDVPLNPVSPYGRSKLMTEWMLADAAKAHGLRYVVLRYFNVAGADPQGRSGQSTANATHLIKVAAQTALGERPFIEVFGADYPTPDGSCIRDFVHVSDLADAHLRALHWLDGRTAGGHEAFNLGSGVGYSVRQAIAETGRIAGKPVPHDVGPRRPGDSPKLVGDIGKARLELGWSPRRDLVAQIEDTLRWRRKMPR